MSFHGKDSSQKAIRRLLKACLLRGMFAQNIHKNWGEAGIKLPDFLEPGLWGMFLRGSKILSVLLYPLLMFCDLFSLLSVMINLWAPITADGTINFRARSMDDVDDNNMNNLIMVAQYTIETPFSWLARKIYKRFRQINFGNTIMGETSTIMGAMAWYDRAPQGNPEIVELARSIVKDY
jgi:hypothetical protein